jgi:hypothetical protein
LLLIFCNSLQLLNILTRIDIFNSSVWNFGGTSVEWTTKKLNPALGMEPSSNPTRSGTDVRVCIGGSWKPLSTRGSFKAGYEFWNREFAPNSRRVLGAHQPLDSCRTYDLWNSSCNGERFQAIIDSFKFDLRSKASATICRPSRICIQNQCHTNDIEYIWKRFVASKMEIHAIEDSFTDISTIQKSMHDQFFS